MDRIPSWLSVALAFALAAGTPGIAASADGEPVRLALRQSLAANASVPVVASGYLRAGDLRNFYAEREFEPLWLEGSGLNGRARTLQDILANAASEGLEPADYRLPPAEADTDGAERLATMELLLSGSLIRYATDLSDGRRSARKSDPDHFIERPGIDAAGILEAAAVSPDLAAYVEGLAPAHPGYRRLSRALRTYRRLDVADGWTPIPDGPSLKPGMRDDRIPQVRRRLLQLGDLARDSGEPDLFDPGLEDAVLAFQRRHGLEPDGVVGRHTRAALNVLVDDRIRQIIVNMERWRWMPSDLGETHILINMAGFELELVENGSTTLSMRIVVGQPYRQTPVFSSQVRYLEFNPFWNVPRSIAVKDILPKVKKDPAYLVDEGFRVLDGWGPEMAEIDALSIDWSALGQDRLPYRLRQDPGPRNALGRVKFMFPNRFDVYMHDTPSRSLFERTVRTFSSGCIRIEKPLELAERLLADGNGWSAERINALADSGVTKAIRLPRPVPVHLTYLTAWADEDGTIHLRDDIYGRDERLANALFGKQH